MSKITILIVGLYRINRAGACCSALGRAYNSPINRSYIPLRIIIYHRIRHKNILLIDECIFYCNLLGADTSRNSRHHNDCYRNQNHFYVSTSAHFAFNLLLSLIYLLAYVTLYFIIYNSPITPFSISSQVPGTCQFDLTIWYRIFSFSGYCHVLTSTKPSMTKLFPFLSGFTTGPCTGRNPFSTFTHCL